MLVIFVFTVFLSITKLFFLQQNPETLGVEKKVASKDKLAEARAYDCLDRNTLLIVRCEARSGLDTKAYPKAEGDNDEQKSVGVTRLLGVAVVVQLLCVCAVFVRVGEIWAFAVVFGHFRRFS